MARRLAQASNHIVKMYDFDFHEHTALSFLVMELGQQDLGQAFQDYAPFSSTERKDIWRQFIDIAMALYSRQIV